MLFDQIKTYHQILFVDSENVGYVLPHTIPSDTFVYLFIRQRQILSKINHSYQNVKIIDLTHPEFQSHKNMMDFCLIVQISLLIHHISDKQKMIILSKDKGYDNAIIFLLKQYPQYDIKRYPLTMLQYFHHVQDYICDDLLYDMFHKHHQMTTLKKSLPKRYHSIFTLESYIEPVSHIHIFIEYDIYRFQYCLYCSGTLKGYYESLVHAKYSFVTLVEKIKNQYQYYYSSFFYKRAKDLKIIPYIMESVQKHQSLQDCLIYHFGLENGFHLFQVFLGNETIKKEESYNEEK